MEVRLTLIKENPDGTRHPINRAYFVMVNMGEDGKPTEAPPLLLNPDDPAEQMEWGQRTQTPGTAADETERRVLKP